MIRGHAGKRGWIFQAEISFVCLSVRHAADRQEEEVRQTSTRDISNIMTFTSGHISLQDVRQGAQV